MIRRLTGRYLTNFEKITLKYGVLRLTAKAAFANLVTP